MPYRCPVCMSSGITSTVSQIRLEDNIILARPFFDASGIFHVEDVKFRVTTLCSNNHEAVNLLNSVPAEMQDHVKWFESF